MVSSSALNALALLLASATLTSASPVTQQRGASVVAVSPKRFAPHPKKVFDAVAARRERLRLSTKFAAGKPQKPMPAKRAVPIEPFDIQEVRRAKDRRQAAGGTDALTDSDPTDQLWYGNLSIGTPPQNTTVDFDTGSSDLVMPLGTCNNCTGPLFYANQSSTFVPSTIPFSIQYADKSGANGTVANETVSVAGFAVENQPFGAVVEESNGFSGPNAALIGMGFPANAETNANPWFFNLALSNKLASNIFSFFLSRHGSAGSELCIGCTDSAKYTGNVSYFPLDPKATNNTQYYWNIDSAGLSYNGSTPSIPINAIIDSGTTLIYVPSAVAESLYSQIKNATAGPKELGDGFYVLPCDEMDNLAPISFIFGSQHFEVDPLDFNLGPVSDNSTSCVGGIVGDNSSGKNVAIVGDEFMKNWYSIFDLGGSRVGFAEAVHPTESD